jgi:cobaltochelatase CobS
VSSLSVGKKSEPNDLLGHPIISKGEWAYQYNPLAVAYRDGHILILNEAAQFDPFQTSFLHDVTERKPLVLANNGGEVILPHPMFRLVFTANSGGRGDMSGLYQGDERMNSALLDRVRYIKVDYVSPEVETQIVSRKIPDLAEVGNGAIVTAMVQAANDIRDAYKNDQVPEPFSTRTLVRWGVQILFNFGVANAVLEALDVAFTAAFDEEEREAYHKIVQNRFGADIEQAILNA